MESQVAKMEPQGHQNDSCCRKSDPFQQSTSQQLPVDRGPAAGGEALKSAALVQPLRCTAHGVSGYTACCPPVQIRVQLFVYTTL